MTVQEMPYRQSLRELAGSLLCLCKAKIAVFAALSAASGLFLVSPHAFPAGVVLPVVAAGVFILAAGAGALNHYQERHTDALMARTSGRPIPAGKIDPGRALSFSLFLIASGAVVLLLAGNPAVPLLGLFAVLWYNGFYTWFKKQSRLAAVPGALVGAISPAIGWVAGGGDVFDLRLAALCFFFFMWQTLHFFIHMLDRGREYERAGLPSLSTIFSERQLVRLTFQWLLAVVVSTQLIVLFGVIHTRLAHAAIVAASFWLLLEGVAFIDGRSEGVHTAIFKKTNYYVLLVMLLLILDGLF